MTCVALCFAQGDVCFPQLDLHGWICGLVPFLYLSFRDEIFPYCSVGR